MLYIRRLVVAFIIVSSVIYVVIAHKENSTEVIGREQYNNNLNKLTSQITYILERGDNIEKIQNSCNWYKRIRKLKKSASPKKLARSWVEAWIKLDNRDLLVLGRLVRAWLGISSTELTSAAVHQMENDNHVGPDDLGGLLNEIEYQARGYGDYQYVIRRRLDQDKKMPWELVYYMYRHDPSRASKVLAPILSDESDSIRKMMWVRHQVRDVLWKHRQQFIQMPLAKKKVGEELHKIVQSDKWWEQAYAAAILNKNPKFRSMKLLRGIQNAQNVVVSRLYNHMVTSDPPPP